MCGLCFIVIILFAALLVFSVLTPARISPVAPNRIGERKKKQKRDEKIEKVER